MLARLPIFHPTSAFVRWQPVAAIIAVGLVASIGISTFIAEQENSEKRLQQRIALERVVLDIAGRFERYAIGLRSLRDFARVETMAGLTQRRFDQFLSRKDFTAEFPAARGIGVISYVRAGEEARFLDHHRQVNGQSDLHIKELAPHAGDRFVIRYVAPIDGNGEALGLDVASEPKRRSAALDAVKLNRETLSAPITLVQVPGENRAGLLFMLPVFKDDMPVETPQQRLEALEGWTYAPLLADQVLADIEARLGHYLIRVVDIETGLPLTDQIKARDVAPNALQSTAFELMGRRWAVTLAPVAKPGSTGEPEYAFAATFLLFSLLALLVHFRMRHRAAERRHSHERGRLGAIVERASDAMLSSDRDGRILSWNAAACRLFQYTQAQAVGGDIASLITEEATLLLQSIRSGRELPDAGVTLNLVCRRKDGSVFPAQISFFSLGKEECSLGVSVRDMTEQYDFEQRILQLTHKLRDEVKERTAQLDQSLALQAEIHHLAMHDPLTGLVNRTLFRERLMHAVARHAQEAETGFALLALDLDRFKPVNDTYGHPIGDTLLAEIGKRLRACVHPDETVARLGGDEFAILISSADSDVAIATADRVIEAVQEPFLVQGLQLEIGVSIGIAVHDGAARHLDADETFRLADNALYAAKRNGRGGYSLCSDQADMLGPSASRIALEMRESLRKGEFHLQYQPIIDCATRRLIGFEALLRWQHPVRGSIPPSEFIPIAEESDLIAALGDWALKTACEEAASWDSDVQISVNVSPAQIRRPGWDDNVIATLEQTGIGPERVVIEVTESVLMADSEQVLQRLRRLQNYGLSIALDDFGTGYSSLSYLRKFRFDKLKIDKSFIRDAEDVVCAAIIRCIVRIGRMLSLVVVAEGIETQAQLDLIESEGCTQVQGYYFAKPMDAEDAQRFIVNAPETPRRARASKFGLKAQSA